MRRGFFIFEVIVGLALLALAGLVLIVATSRLHVASSRLADSRAATHAAESVLSRLQAGLTASNQPPDVRVHITRNATTGDKNRWQWVEVTAIVRGQSRTLTGRVPSVGPQTAPMQGENP